MRRCLTLLVLVACASANAQLTSQERQGITDALFVGNLRLSDLQFARKPFADPYRMPTVDLAIDDPLKSADALMMLHAQSAEMSAAQLLAACMIAIDQEPIGAIQHDPPFSGLDQLPA